MVLIVHSHANVAGKDADRTSRGAQASEERSSRVETDKGADETEVVEVSRRSCEGAKRLDGRITLSGLQDVVGREAPATQSMAEPALLAFEERQLLAKQERPGAGVIQAREAILALLDTERILGKGVAVASGEGAEDFTGVIEGLGPGEGAAHRELLEEVVGAEFQLQAVVIGVAGVGAGAHNAVAAIHAADVCSGAGAYLLGGRARSKPGRNHVRERSFQISNEGIRIDALEEVISLVAYVAGFNSCVLGDLTLNAQRVALDAVMLEVGGRDGLVKGARISRAGREKRSKLSTNHGTEGIRGQRIGRRIEPSQRLQKHLRR